MTEQRPCEYHSGLEARMEALDTSYKEQWKAIDQLRNRLPIWASTLMSILTFFLGCALTYAAMAIKIAEIIKKP